MPSTLLGRSRTTHYRLCCYAGIRQVLAGCQSRRRPETHRRGQPLQSEARNAKNAPESAICGVLPNRPTPTGSVLWPVPISDPGSAPRRLARTNLRSDALPELRCRRRYRRPRATAVTVWRAGVDFCLRFASLPHCCLPANGGPAHHPIDIAGSSRASHSVCRGKPSVSGPDGLPEVHLGPPPHGGFGGASSAGCGWPACVAEALRRGEGPCIEAFGMIRLHGAADIRVSESCPAFVAGRDAT